MTLQRFVSCSAVLGVLSASALFGQTAKSTLPPLSAAQVIDKNVEARGGVQAWRAVQTLSFSGKAQAGGDHPTYAEITAHARTSTGHGSKAPDPITKEQVALPFTMEFKRPGKSRVEIQFAGQTAVQVYDGTNGWKLRPFLNRRDVEPFTPMERTIAATESDFEGPLVDYRAKGSKVEMVGTEKVEGHDCYKIRLTRKSGEVQQFWVDGLTFFELKMQGAPRHMDGKMRDTEVYFRDFRKVDAIAVPFETETVIPSLKDRHKIIVENATVNPRIDDSRFAKLR